MSTYWRQRSLPWLISLVWLCLTSTHAMAQTLPQVMPVDVVTAGRIGVGKTVISGAAVQEFTVEVVGIVRGQGLSQSLILVRTSGPLIERTGGIAAGMSGSPVYIDGQLVGAIAYGFTMADHTLGLLTPAVDMVQLLHGLQASSSDSSRVEQASGELPNAVVLSSNAIDAERLTALVPPHVSVAVPVGTPLLVSGLGERTQRLLGTTMRPWNMVTVPAGTAPEDAVLPPLQPGSALGVQLVRGDIEMTALGTLTILTDDSFVGFGHPFLNRGYADYFATGGYIHTVVQSIEAPFKVGAPFGQLGRVSQDRGAGVAGHLGSDPDFLDMCVVVRDIDLNSTRQFKFQVVNDEALTGPLVAISLLEAMDRALDRIGQGTASVKATLEAYGLSAPVARDNIFYSASDISAASLGEMVYILQKLLGNDLAEIKPHSLTFQIDVQTARQTARIEKATVKPKQVKAGSTVEVEVTLRPFRGQAFTKTIPLVIPSTTLPGDTTIHIRGGGYGIPRLAASDVAAQLEEPADDDEDEDELEAPSDLDKLLTALFDADRNHELVVEMISIPSGDRNLLDVYDTVDDPEQKGLTEQIQIEPLKVRVVTDSYIQGSINVNLEVLSLESNDTPSEDSNNTNE